MLKISKSSSRNLRPMIGNYQEEPLKFLKYPLRNRTGGRQVGRHETGEHLETLRLT